MLEEDGGDTHIPGSTSFQIGFLSPRDGTVYSFSARTPALLWTVAEKCQVCMNVSGPAKSSVTTDSPAAFVSTG